MDPLLTLSDGRAFASGATSYSIGRLDEVAPGRMLIQVRIEGQETIAAVDTGGQYFVCNPGFRELLDLHLVNALEDTNIAIRGHRYHGTLYELTVEIEATRGGSIQIPAIAFIPDADVAPEWSLPNFVGLTGVLDRIRFAVDPEETLFYFGPLGEG